MAAIDLTRLDVETLDGGEAYVAGQKLHWRGRRFRVAMVKSLLPGYTQVVLDPIDRRGLPVSVPSTDLADAVPAS